MAQARGTSAGVALPERLEGRALLAARTAWLVLVVGSVILALAGLARAFVRPELIAPEAALTVLGDAGIATRRLIVAAVCAPLIGAAGVSAVVFWRRSRDPMALLFTAALVLPFAVSSRGLLAFSSQPVLRHAIPVVAAVALVTLALVLALFPNGRFVPRWTLWLAPAMTVLMVSSPRAGELVMRLPDVPATITVWPTGVVVAGVSALMLLGITAQVHRYRNVSGRTERLQTKWVMAPLGLLFTFVFVVVILPAFFLRAPHRWVGWGIFTAVCFGVTVAPMVANAVLRYRLYAIDRIISRTVSYGLVVTLLAGVYGVAVVVLGWIVSSLSGGRGSALVVAVSTLAVAAAFGPVRALVVRHVDRRFNRTAYDARRSVDGFAHALRDEVELDQIRRRLVAVARDALQPAGTAVWLAPTEGVTTRGPDRRRPS